MLKLTPELTKAAVGNPDGVKCQGDGIDKMFVIVDANVMHRLLDTLSRRDNVAIQAGINDREAGRIQSAELRLAQNILEKSNAELENRVEQRNDELKLSERRVVQQDDELRLSEQKAIQRDDELRLSERRVVQQDGELRLSERRVVQQERLSAIGEMTSGIVHNLNNMLAPSVMLIDAILAEPELPGQVREFAELIKTGSSDASDIVKQLGFLYGDFHSEEKQNAVAMKSVLESVPALTRHKWRDEALKDGRVFTLELAIEDEPEVNGNLSDLRQVVTNLVLNAVDAMPTGGAITLRLFVDNNTSIVEVTDEGLGMSEEQQLKCFEPFYSTKAEGNGLGLSMCYGIVVKKHSGKLLVESDEGKGATFRMELPCTVIPAHGVPLKTHPHTPSSCRILYIDDEPVVRMATAALLKSAGYYVSTAESGEDGLRLFQENSFDVVICDFSMPGMNGRDVAATIKEIRRDMPVILATGWPPAGTTTSQKTMEDCVLQKPISIESFVQAIEEWK